MAVVQHAFVITVDNSGVWSAVQIDMPGLTTTKTDGPWLNESPLHIVGLSINYQNRLPSMDAALEFVRERVADLASQLLSSDKAPSAR
jgi:hypothetical protein